MAPAVRGKAHTCRIRRSIVLMTNRSVSPWPKPSWPPHMQSTTSLRTMASSPPHLPTCWLWYASSAWAISLWPTAFILHPPVFHRVSLQQPSASSSPLSLSLSRWRIHSQTHTFRITCLDVPCNLSKPSQHSELLCKESRGQVGHYLLSCIPLTSHQAGCPGHRWDAAEAPAM